MDTPGYPQEYRGFSLAHAAAIEVFVKSDLDWVAVSPAGDFDHGCPDRTGAYWLATGDFRALISYADFGIALLDEIDQPSFHREQIGVTSS